MEKTRRIILMLDSSRAVDRGVIQGLVEYSHLRGNWSFYRMLPLFQTYPFSKRQTDTILQRLKKLDADGIVGYLPDEPSLLKNIRQRNFPTVTIPLQELIDGVINIRQGIEVGIVGAEHLLNRGFKNFAFCGGKNRWSRVRWKHFNRRIEQAGFTVRQYPLSKELKKRDAELKRLADWLTKLPKPVGLMVCNDERSSDVVDACHLAGLQIPDQVAILELITMK